MDGWMGDTPQTVTTTRAPAVLTKGRRDQEQHQQRQTHVADVADISV